MNPVVPGLYALISNPAIRVQCLGEGWSRVGATVKFRQVAYIDLRPDRGRSVDSRPIAEFREKFVLIGT
jgi:hypothetical protein